jgi:hypothetical protein
MESQRISFNKRDSRLRAEGEKLNYQNRKTET